MSDMPTLASLADDLENGRTSARKLVLFVKEVLRILGDLRGRGLALLIAEQNIGFLEVATRVFVLEGGRIRFSGTVAEMTDNEALRRAYFGLK